MSSVDMYVLSKSEDKRDLVTNKNDILEQSQLFYTIWST